MSRVSSCSSLNGSPTLAWVPQATNTYKYFLPLPYFPSLFLFFFILTLFGWPRSRRRSTTDWSLHCTARRNSLFNGLRVIDRRILWHLPPCGSSTFHQASGQRPGLGEEYSPAIHHLAHPPPLAHDARLENWWQQPRWRVSSLCCAPGCCLTSPASNLVKGLVPYFPGVQTLTFAQRPHHYTSQCIGTVTVKLFCHDACLTHVSSSFLPSLEIMIHI